MTGQSTGEGDDALCVLELEPTHEDREETKETLLLDRQQSIAPVEGGAHGALPLRQVAGAGQQSDVESVEQLGRTQQASPNRCQLQRQRNSCEAQAHGGDCRLVLGSGTPPRVHGLGAREQEAGRRP